MPEIYTELTPPTAVTHTLRLPFTSTDSDNIIIAKTTLLQIFTTTTHATELTAPATSTQTTDRRIHTDEEQGDFAADLTIQRSTIEDVTKLLLIAEYPLHGAIAGMVPIARDNASSALLISYRDAKASLILWEPETAGIQTVSLHYYEREEFVNPVVIAEQLKSDLIVDSGNRAVILRFAGDMLAVLPVRKVDEDLVLEGDVEMDGVDAEVEDDWDPSAPEKDTTMEDVGAEEVNGKAKEGGKGVAELFTQSFVVRAEQLDDAISHIIGLTFLHEYREPTLGILYSPKRTWTGWLEQRKDTVCYIVITLDLDQKACTPLMSVQNLPFDLHTVVPLLPPIGGSLLIGSNEIIHVDQAGKTTGVAVNSYYKKATNFGGLADQSALCMALEGSNVVELEGEGGDMLLLLKDGSAAILGFKMDGRNVSGVKITRIANHPGALVGGVATSAIALGGKKILVSCAEGDTRIMKWKRVGEKKPVSAKALGADDLGDMDVEDMYEILDDDVDDDLYGGSTTDLSGARKDGALENSQALQTKTKGEYIFQTHDRLVNIGPIRGIALGRPHFPTEDREKQKDVAPELEIVTTTGPTRTPEDAGISVIRRSIAPQVVGRFNFPACKALWTVRARSAKATPSAPATDAAATGEEEQKRSAEEDYERYLFVSKDGESQVFHVNDAFEEVKDTEFEQDGETVEVGVVGDGSRLVQVVAEQVRVYDCDMQLAQIVPMADEETGEDGPPVISAKVCDPYVVLLKEDKTIQIHKLDRKDMELAPEDTGTLNGCKYVSVSVYTARAGEFKSKKDGEDEEHLISVLTLDGCFQIFDITDLNTPLFEADNFTALPPILTHHTDTEAPKGPTDQIVEAVLADLGDYVAQEPYIIARSAQDDITMYKLFRAQPHSTISFIKIPNPTLSTPRASAPPTAFQPMTILPNLAGHTSVFIPGADPTFIMKTSHSIPHLHRLAGTSVRSLASFHTSSADRGFIYCDDNGTIRVSLLPAHFTYDGPFSSRKISLPHSLRAITYFAPMEVYVASTTTRVPFTLDTEDGAPETVEPDTFYPDQEHSSLIIINPLTWSIVDTHPFAHNEVVIVVTAIPMEISEHTHEHKTLIAVGTGIFRGEDHSARGAIYVFEVIEVVPEPGLPETNRKLKLVVREEVKGTVSAICGVNGYLLAAQGQKVMVRGLKEDQSLLPVAFMDMNSYVTVAKNLEGMLLFGDFTKSAWFAGFSEEPYKMTLFGKDAQGCQVVAAEFLPDGENLKFVLADAGGNLLVLQYDPEHPKSVAGQRLIRRAAFHVGHEITSLTLLPSSRGDSQHLVLTATRSGGLGTLGTVPENLYRRLNILQSQIGAEECWAGLNHKAFRHVRGSEREGEMLRGVLDAGVLGGWGALGVGRRGECAGKAGVGGREEVKGVSGEGGLGYL